RPVLGHRDRDHVVEQVSQSRRGQLSDGGSFCHVGEARELLRFEAVAGHFEFLEISPGIRRIPNDRESMDRSIDRRPLILLELDGVINDLGSLSGMERPWRVDIVRSHGYDVHVPSYMPALIRALDDLAEIRWLTTWRHMANDAVADQLGVGPFPVIDDGT